MKGSKRISKFLAGLFVLILICITEVNAQQNEKRPLDIVFCLDLSGSTNGLINDMRNNLWLIVNQANNMKPAPDLRIGVVGFSRPSFGKNSSYVKVLCDLTRNFDFLAAELFKLKPSIEKGDQIVSAAISTCVTQMSWSKSPTSFKVVFLCGNGLVTSNGNEYLENCEQAEQKNIIINTLYIPKNASMFRELPAWRRIATITHGMQSELTVNQNDSVVVFPIAKFDSIDIINNKLNDSFLWAGRDSSNCRRSLVTADSGAYYTLKDPYYNRVYYKLSNDYSRQIRNCELVYTYTMKEVVASSDPIASESYGGEEFIKQLNEQKLRRNKIIAELKKQLPDHFIEEYKQKYLEGKMLENNIFQRVVLNILFKEYER